MPLAPSLSLSRPSPQRGEVKVRGHILPANVGVTPAVFIA